MLGLDLAVRFLSSLPTLHRRDLGLGQDETFLAHLRLKIPQLMLSTLGLVAQPDAEHPLGETKTLHTQFGSDTNLPMGGYFIVNSRTEASMLGSMRLFRFSLLRERSSSASTPPSSRSAVYPLFASGAG